MDKVLLKTRCTKGHLVIYEDRVAIELNTFGIHNVNSLPFSSITGVDVQVKAAPILFTRGAATVIVYSKGDQKLVANFVAFKDAQLAEKLVRARIGGNPSTPVSSIGELEKLAELKDKGIINQEEFDKKKKQLLGL